MCPRSQGLVPQAWGSQGSLAAGPVLGEILHECEAVVGAQFIWGPGMGRSEAPSNEDPCFREQMGGRGGSPPARRQRLGVHFWGQHRFSTSLDWQPVCSFPALPLASYMTLGSYLTPWHLHYLTCNKGGGDRPHFIMTLCDRAGKWPPRNCYTWVMVSTQQRQETVSSSSVPPGRTHRCSGEQRRHWSGVRLPLGL